MGKVEHGIIAITAIGSEVGYNNNNNNNIIIIIIIIRI